MKTIRFFSLLAVALFFIGGTQDVFATGESTESVTLEGKIVCGKCALKLPGQNKCHNVLSVVEKGEPVYYFITKNDVSREFGEVCMDSKKARVTGTISIDEGKLWITPTSITVL